MKITVLILISSVLLLAPLSLSANNDAMAQNSVFQGINQEQFSSQLGICLSGQNTFISCNNLSFQNQENFGDNVAGQQGGSGSGGGNFAAQGISQSQTSNQGGICVSGGSTALSCNNLSFQNQENFGDNVAGQQGGSGSGGGNFAAQGISQSQTSNQNSLCVSGGDTTASCNNFNSQSQVNYGNNVIAQSR